MNQSLYYPFLRTRQSELNGLANLEDSQKDVLTPVFTMGSWRKKEGFDLPLEKIKESFGERRFILDIDKNEKHLNDSMRELGSSEGNYKNWVKFSQQNALIIPIVQFSQESSQRSYVRQAMALEQGQGGVAFRIQSKQDAVRAAEALNALEYPNQATLLIDAGYIRDITTQKVKPSKLKSLVESLNLLNTEYPKAGKILSSTSFPRSVMQFIDSADNLSGKIDILENSLYDEVGMGTAAYGDHASIHSVVYDRDGGRFLPRIDLPSDGYWHFERRPDTDAEGFVDAARTMLEKHPQLREPKSWGEQMIVRTAERDASRIKSPAAAIAVRVNLHMNYQLELLGTSSKENDDEDFWDL